MRQNYLKMFNKQMLNLQQNLYAIKLMREIFIIK